MTKIAALLVAAGNSARMGSEIPKPFLPLGPKAVLEHALAPFLAHPLIDTVMVMVNEAHCALWQPLAAQFPDVLFLSGGASRQESVLRGLEHLAALSAPDLILIHDAARPFVEGTVIDRLLAALHSAVGAIAALPVVDTLKKATPDGFIAATRPRDGLWQAQTPQAFHFAPLLAAHQRFKAEEVTDDAVLLEKAGLAVQLVRGEARTFKITTPDDLTLARALVPPCPRFGQGFDVHRLVPGEGVTLGGVFIPCDLALEGHSDADVALHALTDAVLGLGALGDIGDHFPPSDPKWRGQDSRHFLRHAVRLTHERGMRFCNVDLTIICEYPKISPHKAAMRAVISEDISIPLEAVSVKATTTEGLGFTGRGEGIAAMAVVGGMKD